MPEIKAVQGAPAGASPITLLQVATMMSGLAREPGCAESLGRTGEPLAEEGDRLPAADALPVRAGTQYLYSNIGYASLGLAIERAGGAPFIAQVEAAHPQPLGMTRSAFEPTPALRAKPGAWLRQRQGTQAAPSRTASGRRARRPRLSRAERRDVQHHQRPGEVRRLGARRGTCAS